MQEKIKKTPQKKPKNKTEVKRFIDKAFNWVEKSNTPYKQRMSISPEFGFDDLFYDPNIVQEDELNSISKKMTEVAMFNAVKENKAFQKTIDKLAEELSSALMRNVRLSIKQIEQDRKYMEKERILDEKYASKQEAIQLKQAEKLKKEHAQRAILLEGITAPQKRALKKLYNVDITKNIR